MAKTFNAPTYEAPQSEVLKKNKDVREPFEKVNEEQHQSLMQLEAQNMLADSEAENPFDKWDESEHTPEYMMECADYAAKDLKEKDDKKDVPQKDSYFEHLDEVKKYYQNEFGEEGLVDPNNLQDGLELEGEEAYRELTTKEKAQKAWRSLQYAYYGYEIAQGRPEVALQGMFVKWGMECGNTLIDAQVQDWKDRKAAMDAQKQAELNGETTVKVDDALKPESKQESLEMDVPQIEEHAGAAKAIEDEQKSKEVPQDTPEEPKKSNSAVEALMAKYEADSKAYEARNMENEQNMSVLESKQYSKKFS